MADWDADLAIRDIANMKRGFEFEMARAGGLRAVIDLLEVIGRDPKPLLEAAGLSLMVFRDPEAVVPLSAALQVLTEAIKATGLPHFGLLAGARNGIATLGLFGHLALTAPDVKTGVEDLIGFLFVHDRFARARLATAGDTAKLDYLFDYPTAPGAHAGVDFVIAAMTKMLRGLCGEDWRPSRVRLPRRRPADAAPFVELLRAEVVFGSEHGSIEFPARWLSRPLAGSNESLRFYLLGLVRQAMQVSDTEAERVRRIIRTQLVGGRPNAVQAAALLHVHRRTLARRLAAEGLSFKQLAQELRFEMARDMLVKSNAPMSTIADLLGYSDPAVFSRAFSNRFGRPPSEMRKAGV
jgi:AraC-like DNA-binding protein